VVSDGETLWIHDVEGGTVTRLEVTAGYLSGAALQFLLGDGDLLEEFDVTATACDAERVSLELLPKKDASYERLGLVAARGTGDIEATSVVDLFGNRTQIRFERVEINQSPDESVFEFQVPDGVELIDYAAANSDMDPRSD
jgi:outer membrane lipoprotein carrier protein